MTGGGVLGLLAAWFPVLLLIGVWLVLYQKSRDVYTGKSGKSHGELLEEHIAELKRQNDLFEKIVKDQETRLQKLETRRQNGSSGASATSSGGAGGR